MRKFNVGKTEIICESGGAGRGYYFCHIATLFIDGVKSCSHICKYQNRTWEVFQYESVLKCILEKSKQLSKLQKTLYAKKYISNRG